MAATGAPACGGESFADGSATIYAYDAKNNILYAAMSNAHDLYQGVNMGDGNIDGRNGAIFYSTDKGATWKHMCAFPIANPAQMGFNPVMAVELDPNVPNRMYALVANHVNGGVFRTDDLDKGEKATWTKMGAPSRPKASAPELTRGHGSPGCLVAGHSL